MKSLICLFAMLAVIPAARAQVGTPEFDPLGEFNQLPKQLRVQVEFIGMPHPVLTKLMAGEEDRNDGAELRKQVGDLVAGGKAEVFETLICVARSGQKATAESVLEYIFPTEYEPGGYSEEVVKAAAETGTPLPRPPGPTGTAFETRNVGSTLEIEPTLGEDGKVIDLRMVPELVYQAGEKVWGEWKDERGDSSVKMPLFYTVRMNSAFTLLAGEPVMVGVVSPKGDDGVADRSVKLMVFVKVDVLTVGLQKK